MQLTVDGLVLRRHAAGQEGQDSAITILTGEHGVLTAYAGRTGAMKSKLSAATQALCYSRFVLFKGRSGYIVDGADCNRFFFGLMQDYSKLCLGSYFAQLAKEICPQGEPAPEALRLLLNSLHCLEEGSRDQRQLKAILETRLLTLSGFMPDLVACGGCGAFQDAGMRFFPAQGDLLCPGCLSGSGRSGGVPVSPGVLAAMRHILYAPAEKLFSFTLGEEGLNALEGASEQYLLSQVERSFSALELYRASAFGPAQAGGKSSPKE